MFGVEVIIKYVKDFGGNVVAYLTPDYLPMAISI
jgi:hypothetical protein